MIEKGKEDREGWREGRVIDTGDRRKRDRRRKGEGHRKENGRKRG